MKKILTVMLIVASLTCLSSCSEEKNEINSFKYPLPTLWGTWEGTEVLVDGFWFDINNLGSKYQFSITFYDNDKYTGRGYFGNGSGTYVASGNIIKTYVKGKLYLVYEFVNLNVNTAHLIMSDGVSNEKIQIKAKKTKQLDK